MGYMFNYDSHPNFKEEKPLTTKQRRIIGTALLISIVLFITIGFYTGLLHNS